MNITLFGAFTLEHVHFYAGLIYIKERWTKLMNCSLVLYWFSTTIWSRSLYPEPTYALSPKGVIFLMWVLYTLSGVSHLNFTMEYLRKCRSYGMLQSSS